MENVLTSVGKEKMTRLDFGEVWYGVSQAIIQLKQ